MLLAHYPTTFEVYVWNSKEISPELAVLGKARFQRCTNSVHLISSFTGRNIDCGWREVSSWGVGMDTFVEEFRCCPIRRAKDIMWFLSALSLKTMGLIYSRSPKNIFLYLSGSYLMGLIYFRMFKCLLCDCITSSISTNEIYNFLSLSLPLPLPNPLSLN